MNCLLSVFDAIIAVVISDDRVFRVLFPFGSPLGDVLLPPSLDANSGPQSKLAISNVTCPFFGTSESIIYVSCVVACGLFWFNISV